jgi:hypothetical protein
MVARPCLPIEHRGSQASSFLRPDHQPWDRPIPEGTKSLTDVRPDATVR